MAHSRKVALELRRLESVFEDVIAKISTLQADLAIVPKNVPALITSDAFVLDLLHAQRSLAEIQKFIDVRLRSAELLVSLKLFCVPPDFQELVQIFGRLENRIEETLTHFEFASFRLVCRNQIEMFRKLFEIQIAIDRFDYIKGCFQLFEAKQNLKAYETNLASSEYKISSPTRTLYSFLFEYFDFLYVFLRSPLMVKERAPFL